MTTADVMTSRPCLSSVRKQPSFRLNGLSSHGREASFRLNAISRRGREQSFRLAASGHSRQSCNRSTCSGNSTISGNSIHDFGASIRVCDAGEDSLASFGELDMSTSMSLSGSSHSTRRGICVQRWGDRSVKFSAKNFVAQNEDSLDAHYLVGELLGEGGFGEVYSCTHIQSGEERAVKVIPKQEDEGENIKVIEEFDIVKDLDHPNILKMYALFESEDNFFLVTDIYAGGELYDELAEFGRFAEEEAALLMNNVLSCINYCHQKGLVHRDLKPENILLEENKDFDDLKIIDFGLADYGEVFTELEGSSYYVSPQVVEGRYGLKTDVWSCGVIAFVCLAGYAPYEGATDEEVLRSVIKGNLAFDDPAWDDVSEEARDFVAYLLTYDEDERPSAGDALQHPWLKNARKDRRSSDCTERRETTRTSLGFLQSFQANSKLKQCVCSLISSQLLRKDEKEEIDMVFRSLDFDCDGKLTKDDVKQSYKEFFGQELNDEDIDLMFLQVNFSGSGAIEYSEFVASTIMEKNMVDEAKLWAAFKIFDRDDKGYISNEDLKEVLALDDGMEEYILHKIIRQVDKNGDGKIQFEEFQDMMFSNTVLPPSKKLSSQSSMTPRKHKMKRSNLSTDSTVAPSETPEEGAEINQDDFNLSFRSVLTMYQKKCSKS